MKQKRTKQRLTPGNSVKPARGGKSGRLVAAAALLALAPALAVFACSRPAVVGPRPGPAAARAEAVSLVLRPEGFDPPRVSRDGGQFTLSVTNQAGASQVTLHLYRSSGERVRELSVAAGATWSEEVSLAAGNYTLVAPDNPAWSCGLTVR